MWEEVIEEDRRLPVDSKPHDPEPAALEVLEGSLAWYKEHAWRARRLYHADEVAILVVGALIPAAVALKLGDCATVLLGVTAAILAGLRSIFRWHDDWLRFTEACVQLATERELYRFKVDPYHNKSRNQKLIQYIREIETAETQGWLHMRKASTDQQTADSRTTPSG